MFYIKKEFLHGVGHEKKLSARQKSPHPLKDQMVSPLSFTKSMTKQNRFSLF